MTRITRGYWIAIVGTIIWSTTAIFIRYLTQNYQLPPLLLAFWRDFFVAGALLPGLLIFARKKLKVQRKHWPFLLLYGFILSLFNSLWTVSVDLNGAAVSTVLVYSSPAFTALIAWKIFKEKLTWLKFGLVLLSFTGSILVAGAYDAALWQVQPIGIITGILSGLIFAIYSLMGKSAANRGIDPWVNLCIIFAVAAVFLFLYNTFLPTSVSGNANHSVLWSQGDLKGWTLLVLLALVPTLGGYGLYNVSLHYLPAVTSNLIASTEPVYTGVLAWFILAERFSLLQMIGSAIILASVILMRLFFEVKRENLQPGV